MENFNIPMIQQLREYSWDNQSWFLPLAHALEGLTAKDATWQPLGGGNTIWQTLNHINYYNDLMLSRMKGIPKKSTTPTNTDTFDTSNSPQDDEAWEAVLKETHQLAHDIKEALASLNEDILSKNDLASQLTAWVMHDAYHTGQIVLIRKMQSSWPAIREY